MKTMMRNKLIPFAVALACAAQLTAPAFAADTQPAAKDTQSVIPVTISADATTFDVTVPTTFPTTVDPDTGETIVPNDPKITNNSSASIVVTQIKVTNYGGWNLGGFDEDLRNKDVDANTIGVSVQPVGGRSGTAGTTLKTVAATSDAMKAEQILLNASSDEWVIDAKDDTSDADQLSVHYDTNTTPVSESVTNKTVANIVITLSWNK